MTPCWSTTVHISAQPTPVAPLTTGVETVPPRPTHSPRLRVGSLVTGRAASVPELGDWVLGEGAAAAIIRIAAALAAARANAKVIVELPAVRWNELVARPPPKA